MIFKKIILVLLVSFLFQNCTKEIDFDQIDDANIYATYLVTLTHLNFTAPNFLDDNNDEIELTTDAIAAKISEDSLKYLEKVEFTLIIKNTFNRELSIEIVFYNETGAPIYTLEPVIVAANYSEIKVIREIPESDIDVIFTMREIGFNVILPPSIDGSVILLNDTSILNLKSYMKLFYNYRNI